MNTMGGREIGIFCCLCYVIAIFKQNKMNITLIIFSFIVAMITFSDLNYLWVIKNKEDHEQYLVKAFI